MSAVGAGPLTPQQREDPVESEDRATRRSPRGERRREAILDAAVFEFADKGYRGASLAAIADRCGITQSGLLHHYPTKEALLDAVIQARFQRDARVIDAALPDGTMLSSYVELMTRHAGDPHWVQFLTVMAAAGLTADNPARDLIATRYRDVRRRLEGRVAQHLRSQGIEGQLDTAVLAELFVAAMDGLQLQWLYDPSIDMSDGISALIDLVSGYSPSPGPESTTD